MSTDTKELNSPHLVQCYKMGGVTTGWGHQTQHEEGEFGFSCCCFHFFPFNFFFFNILQTAKNYNTSQLQWGGGGAGGHQRKQPHSGVRQGQLNLPGLSCRKGEMGKPRLLSHIRGSLAYCPTSSHFRGVARRAPAFCPCPSSLCFLICWFDPMPGFFPSPATLPVRGQVGGGRAAVPSLSVLLWVEPLTPEACAS